MNPEPQTSGPKLNQKLPWLRTWIILTAVLFLVVFVAIGMLNANHCNLPTMGWTLAVCAPVAALLLGLWQLLRIILHPRNWRRTLFGFACFATLIALFYAEEDWRAEHAWQQFQREGNARGERYDYASIIPAPVPDDQNFALTPIVYSCYGQLFDQNGKELRPHNTNLVNRLSMEYYAGDSLDATHEALGNWQTGTKTDFAPLANYYRTLAAKTNLFPVPAQAGTPAADVLSALSRYDSVIEELRQAAQQPYSRFPLTYDKENCAAILLPHLGALKHAGQVLQRRSLAELQTGQPAQALADIQLQQRLADSIRTEPFLISHLVRIALLQIEVQPVWEGLADHRWNDAQLAALDHTLAGLDFLADYQTSIRGERDFDTKLIEYFRHHLGELPEIIFTPDNSGGHMEELFVLLARLAPSGWLVQNELNSTRFLDQCLMVADPNAHTFKPAAFKQADDALADQIKTITPYNIIMRKMTSALGSFAQRFVRAQSAIDLARTAIALERYRLAHGQYPDSLAPLAPKYIEAVPYDVIGGQPLHYRLEANGQFILYSVGWDEKDDGGTVVIPKGSHTSSPTQGDWVWRYPVEVPAGR
jgi:hypothetical protein